MKIVKNEILNLSNKTLNQTIFDLKKSYRAQLLILKGQMTDITKNITLIHHYLLPQYKLYYYWYSSFREENPDNPNFLIEPFEIFLNSLKSEDYYQIFNSFLNWYSRIEVELLPEKIRGKTEELFFYLDQTDNTDKNLFILNSINLIYDATKYKSTKLLRPNQEKELLLACLILDAQATVALIANYKDNYQIVKQKLYKTYLEKKAEWKKITKYEPRDKLFQYLVQANIFSTDDNVQIIFEYWNIYIKLKLQGKFIQALSLRNTVKYLLFIPYIKTFTDRELIKLFKLNPKSNPQITSTISDRLCNYYNYKGFNQIKPAVDSLKIEQIYFENLF